MMNACRRHTAETPCRLQLRLQREALTEKQAGPLEQLSVLVSLILQNPYLYCSEITPWPHRD